MNQILDVLKQALDVGASDIFVIAGLPLTYKVNGTFDARGNP